MSNYWLDEKKISFYESLFGSRFAAISYIASEARKLAESNHNIISHSESLACVVTGYYPEKLKNLQYTSYEDSIFQYELDILNYVDDEGVKQSVIDTINTSRRHNHLIYVYSESLEECKYTRVRILSKLVWERSLLQLET